jgi:hypothetical protein
MPAWFTASFRFMDLPAEMRNEIYRHVFGSDFWDSPTAAFHWSSSVYSSKNWFSGSHSILYVNRQIRAECKSFFISSKRFFVPAQLFAGPRGFRDFIGGDQGHVRAVHWSYSERDENEDDFSKPDPDLKVLNEMLEWTTKCVNLRYLMIDYQTQTTMPQIGLRVVNFKRKIPHEILATPEGLWSEILKERLEVLVSMRGLKKVRFLFTAGYSMETESEIEAAVMKYLAKGMCA